MEESCSWIVAQEWVNPETSPWKVKEGPLITTSSANRWSILESKVGSSQESGKVLSSNVLFENEPSSSSTSSSNAAAALKQDDVSSTTTSSYFNAAVALLELVDDDDGSFSKRTLLAKTLPDS
ncbi:hypothetical protein Tco_0069289 [Tanacetum coccineum]